MSNLTIISPWKDPKSRTKATTGISIEYYTGYFSKIKFTAADNVERPMLPAWVASHSTVFVSMCSLP